MHDVCTISFKLNNLKTSVGGQDFWREGFDDQFFWIFWWTITGSSEMINFSGSFGGPSRVQVSSEFDLSSLK